MPRSPRTALPAALATTALVFGGALARNTSVYTDLRVGWTDDRPDDGSGSDIPQSRPGVGGWTLHKSFSAAAEHLGVERPGAARVDLAPLAARCDLPRSGETLEWRLRAGRPVAVIVRVRCFEVRPDGTEGKRLGEYLLVRGLGTTLAHDVDARSRDANAVARRLADGGR